MHLSGQQQKNVRHIASCAKKRGLNVDHAPQDRPLVFDDQQIQMERELTKESVVRGHNIYKEVWQPKIGIKRLLSRVYADFIRKRHAPDRQGALSNEVA